MKRAIKLRYLRDELSLGEAAHLLMAECNMMLGEANAYLMR